MSAISSSEPTTKPSARAPATFWKANLRRPGFLALLLALVTLAVYLQVARFDFVNYDDSDYVTANSHVQNGLKWENVAWAFTTGHASNWHPLTWLSHMLDSEIFGKGASGPHVVNAAFHVANTVLLFLVLRRLTGATWRSALVAALFALHPLHVESVAWISERKDVLSALFWILTIWAYAAYVARVECQVTDAKGASRKFVLPTSVLYLLSLMLFALGLMSKPMVVTLPFVLLLLDFWPLDRWRAWSVGRGASDEEGGRIGTEQSPRNTTGKSRTTVHGPLALLLEKIPFFALSIVSCYVTFIVQRKGGAVSTSISLGARVANALVSYVRYISKMLWPQKLAVLYPHPGHWPAWQVAAAAGLLVLICAAVVVLARKRPYMAVGWLWFLGTLVPAIGLVQVGVQSMADRYTYLPMIGLFIMLVWGGGDVMLAQIASLRRSSKVQDPRSREDPRSKLQTLSAGDDKIGSWDLDLPWILDLGPWIFLPGFVLVACAVLTFHQLGFWRNSETLFAHAVQVTKGNYLAYNNLGFYLGHIGKTDEAMENYRQALKINPAYEDALNNVGYALAKQKKPQEALLYYEAALRSRPNQAEVHNNLGNALADLGRGEEAMAHYRRSLELQPEHADAHNNLAIALAMKGQFDEAISHFHQALRSKPDDASAHCNLGNAYTIQHKLKEAIQEYKESLRIKPDDAQTHNNLGNVLAEQGLLAEAIPQYQKALELNADNPEAHFNLGMALARQGRKQEAVDHYKQALRLRPDYAEARRQLEAVSAAERK